MTGNDENTVTNSSPNGHRALRITRDVFEAIRGTIGTERSERGGALGGHREEGVVRHFHFDESARTSGGSYSPDHETLNTLFRSDWNPRGINLLGFVHSHPASYRSPSPGDLAYARDILARIPELDRLLLPIVMTEPDTDRFELLPFAAVRHGRRVETQPLELVVEEPAVAEEPMAVVPAARTVEKTAAPETFLRVEGAYDLAHLALSRVICVGVGGAAGFVEDLARAGVSQFVLIDPDTVAETNLATQQVYRKDIGRPKVDCVAERIRDINPTARVLVRQDLLDAIDDADFWRLASAPIEQRVPMRVLLAGCTDSFPAQARVNRLGLQFALPTLCAQVYEQGMGAEVTFTYPGVTPACHRCALHGRYEAYKNGFVNTVGSTGTPIFSSTRLNALKGVVAMALLHYGTGHPRWGGLLARIGKRNLVQIRMNPDLGMAVFGRVFGGGDGERILFDETVWLPQDPDTKDTPYGECPECRGLGDLRKLVGMFGDTRAMP